MELENKVALVTGAGSGIGKATALLFAQQGAKVAALGRDETEAKQTITEIKEAGGTAEPFIADITEPDQMYSAIEQIVRRWGRLDIVFANAGINGVWAAIEEIAPAEWMHTINTNINGTFLTLKYAVPYLKQNGGSIVITSSINGTRVFSNTGATAYSATKAAQVAITKMLAIELARSKVRVNVICPGWIDTEIEENTTPRELEEIRIPVEYPEGSQPLTVDKPGKPEQVAQLVLFLCSEAASHITGSEVWIDGAASLLQG